MRPYFCIAAVTGVESPPSTRLRAVLLPFSGTCAMQAPDKKRRQRQVPSQIAPGAQRDAGGPGEASGLKRSMKIETQNCAGQAARAP